MNKTRQNIYTVFFAVILGLTCATLLTAAAVITGPRQKKNKEAEEIRNILSALKIPFEAKADPEELIAIYKRDIKEQKLGENEPLIIYAYKPEGTDEAKAVAVRFEGKGLWGPVKGFLALEPDFKTIRGLTFYEQEETPGLGGEIVTESFRGRFEGRHIADAEGRWGINIIAGGAEQKQINEIAGISAATMTCDKVEEMINAIIEKLAAKREENGQ